MALSWNGDQVVERLGRLTAGRLLACAATLASAHQANVGQSAGPRPVRRSRTTKAGNRGSRYSVFDRPSKPGEYLRVRTGHGRASTTYEPQTQEGVVAAGLVVRVGFRLPAGIYMSRWELEGGRKGLKDTLNAVRPRLAALAGGGR